MNILNMVILSATLVSTGALAESINAEHLKNKAGQKAEQATNRAEETAHKAKNRLEEKQLQAENRLKNGG
ncbi:TPA: hypothetical protein ACKP2K_005198, partial [Serratia marcescens]